MDDRTYILRVGGVGTTDGQSAYTTRTIGYDPSGPVAHGAIREIPAALSCSVDVLSPLGSAAGLSCALVYGAETSRLLDSRIVAVVDSGGSPIRLAALASATETNIRVSAEPSGLSLGDLLYIGGECMTYGGWVGGTSSIAVTRARLGTVARGIGYSAPGALVLTTHSTVVGRRCALSVAPANAASASEEEVIYRGFVTGLRVDGGTIVLDVASAIGVLRDTPYRMPRMEGIEGVEFAVAATSTGVSARATVGSAGFVLDLAADAVSTSAALSMWLDVEHETRGELAVLVEADGVTVGGRGAVRIADDGAVYAVERDDVRLSSDEAISLLSAPGWRVTGAQLGDIITTTTAAGVITEILTGTAYASARARLTTSDLDLASLASVTRAPRVTPIYSPLYDGTEGVVMPRDLETVGDVLNAFLAPLGCSLAPSRNGTIRAIDWAASVRNAIDVGQAQIRGRAMGWAMADAETIRDVTVTSATYIGEVTSRILSDVAISASLGGRAVEVDCGHVWSHMAAGIRDRWRSIVSLWDRAAPVLTCSVASSVGLEVGNVVKLNVSTLVGYDGQRNAGLDAPIAGVVTSVQPGLSSAQDIVRIVAFGWGTIMRPGVWGPAARVQSYASGVATVDDEFSGGDDALTFDPSVRLWLLSDNGVRLDSDSPPPTATYAAGEITVTWSTVTPNATDVIVPAPTSEQVAVDGVLPGSTYWAEASDSTLVSTGHYTYS